MGLYLRLGGGLGYTTGSYEFRGLSESSFPPVRELHFDISLRGPLVAARAAAGWGVLDGVAVALQAGIDVMPVFARHGALGESNIDGGLLGHVGPIVDIYPFHDDPTHLLLGVALAETRFIWGANDIGSPENIVEDVNVSGYLLQGGVGYHVAPSIDLLVHVSYAVLDNDHARYTPLGFALQAAYVFF